MLEPQPDSQDLWQRLTLLRGQALANANVSAEQVQVRVPLVEGGYPIPTAINLHRPDWESVQRFRDGLQGQIGNRCLDAGQLRSALILLMCLLRPLDDTLQLRAREFLPKLTEQGLDSVPELLQWLSSIQPPPAEVG